MPHQDSTRLEGAGRSSGIVSVSVRGARLVVLISAFGAFVACSSTTAPEQKQIETSAPESPAQPSTGLGALGASLPQATDQFLVSVSDETMRRNLRTVLNGVSGSLIANEFGLARDELASARRLLEKMTVADLVALGPIVIALDQIASAMDESGI